LPDFQFRQRNGHRWTPPAFTNLNVLYYSPSDITFDNSFTMTGQIYGGENVIFNGAAPTLTFAQMDGVPLTLGHGGEGGGGSASLAWERQAS
jgi:hypothetical protein